MPIKRKPGRPKNSSKLSKPVDLGPGEHEETSSVRTRKRKLQNSDVLSMLNGNTTPVKKSAELTPRKSARLVKKEIPTLQSSPVIIESRKHLGTVLNGGVKEFHEPELAEPKPIYTGLPLEAFPTAKIKKQSLWPPPKKKTQKVNGTDRGSSAANSSGSSAPPDESDTSNEEIEQKYKQKLLPKNQDHDLSSLRKVIRSSPPPRSPLSGLKLVIRTPNASNSNKSSPHSRPTPASLSRRVKVISPKKPANTLVPNTSEKEPEVSDSSDDATKQNDDHCSACGGAGVFICCETCPKSFHFTCCDPPLDECPEDSWNCTECTIKLHPELRKSWGHIGLFGPLLNDQEGRNAREFQLPKKLRESTFMDVSTDLDGSYTDNRWKPELSYSKLNGSQIKGHNWNEDLEIDTLYDSNSNPYLCHKCGLSGLGKRSLVHCDYCPLVWHLDCLQDPLCSSKSLGSKWRCPNHVEDLLPSTLFTKRNFKDCTVMEGSLHSHFLEIAAMSNILIKHRNQNYIKDSAIVTLEDYAQFQENDFAQGYEIEKVPVPSSEEGVHKLPEYFENYATNNGKVVAKASEKLSRVLCLNDRSNDTYTPNAFIYRVPEELIALSFIGKCKELKKRRGRPKRAELAALKTKLQVLSEINNYEQKRQTEGEQVQQVVDILSQLKSHPVTSLPPKPAPLTLPLQSPTEIKRRRGRPRKSTQRAISNNEGDIKSEERLALPEVMVLNQTSADAPVLNPEEVDELLHIKKLIQMKGKESLLEFLKS